MINNEKEICENFIRWNLKAQKLHISNSKLDCNEREIWWIHLGQNIGWEQNGKGKDFLRPALIVRKFNQNLLWIVPLTRTIRSGNYFCTLKAQKSTGQLILIQLKTIDSVRLVQKIERIDKKQYEKICNLIRQLL